MIISERIFKILNDKNMSQNTFARRAGLAGSTISDWKTKKTNPSADKIMDICAALDVTPEQLLTGRGIDEEPGGGEGITNSREPQFTRTELRIMNDIHGLKEEQQKRLRKYIAALKRLEALENME